ncbi:MAG: hypothetical protein JXA41_05635 [Deltaproteobacteria bacterium]|nr:hypothetical protein [Deltaproteobacteria bacterium]
MRAGLFRPRSRLSVRSRFGGGSRYTVRRSSGSGCGIRQRSDSPDGFRAIDNLLLINVKEENTEIDIRRRFRAVSFDAIESVLQITANACHEYTHLADDDLDMPLKEIAAGLFGEDTQYDDLIGGAGVGANPVLVRIRSTLLLPVDLMSVRSTSMTGFCESPRQKVPPMAKSLLVLCTEISGYAGGREKPRPALGLETWTKRPASHRAARPC